MPLESSATGRVTMREISPASTSTAVSASRKMNAMRSRTEISESTVSCTSVSSSSAPVRCPSASSGDTKQPTHTREISRPVSASSTDGACVLPAPSRRWKP